MAGRKTTVDNMITNNEKNQGTRSGFKWKWNGPTWMEGVETQTGIIIFKLRQPQTTGNDQGGALWKWMKQGGWKEARIMERDEITATSNIWRDGYRRLKEWMRQMKTTKNGPEGGHRQRTGDWPRQFPRRRPPATQQPTQSYCNFVIPPPACRSLNNILAVSMIEQWPVIDTILILCYWSSEIGFYTVNA